MRGADAPLGTLALVAALLLGSAAGAGAFPATALAGLTPPLALSPAPADTLTLVIQVVEAGENRPLVGAAATLVGSSMGVEEVRRTAISTPQGEIFMEGLPPGDYTLTVESFGYTTARIPLTLPRRFPVRAGLAPAPIVLDGLVAEAAAVLRMEERRRALPYQVRALDSHALARELRPLADVLATEELGLEGCPTVDDRTLPCRPLIGRHPAILYCLDERQIEAEIWELDQIRPRDLYSVEVLQRELLTIVYMLSHNYVDRRVREGAALPWSLPCYTPDGRDARPATPTGRRGGG